jgi:hypothetical protein
VVSAKKIWHNRLKNDLVECLAEKRRVGVPVVRAIEQLGSSWGIAHAWLSRLYYGNGPVAVTAAHQQHLSRGAINTLLELAEQHSEDAQRCVFKADRIRRRELQDEEDRQVRKRAAQILFRQADKSAATARRLEQQAMDLLNEEIPGLFGETRQWSGPLRRQHIA